VPESRRFTGRKLIAIFCSALFLSFTISAAFSPSVQADGPEISVSPQAALRDGQVVTVTWSGFNPYSLIAIRQCVAGATDSTKCSAGASGMLIETSDRTGSGMAYFKVVSTEGTVNSNLPGADGTKCGVSFPCDVSLTLLADVNQPASGLLKPITFSPEPTSCPTENMKNITGGGSGALTAAMPAWQIALCKGAGRVNVDYLATRGDEGGRQDFYCGLIDFAVTEIKDEEGEKCMMTGQVRKGIYVPIANTALVFAYSMRNRADQQHLKSIKLTPSMLAQTMTGQALNWGSHSVSSTKDVAIFALNNSDSPQVTGITGDGSTITVTARTNLNVGDTVIVDEVNPPGYNSEYQVTSVNWVDDADHTKGQSSFTVDGGYKRAYISGGLVNPTNLLPGNVSVYGRADASGLNFLMTRFFLERAAAAFHAPGGQFSEEGFPVASVYMPLADSLDPTAFRSNSDAVVTAMRGSDDLTGGTGYLAPMDAATAKFNGLPAVSIQSVDGSRFIAPTTESIKLGIDEMTKDAATGVASANLAPSNPNAYPLVFTIYALVPEEAASKESAQALQAMLTQIRDHSGDSEVSSGYVGLTSAQKQQITSAIGKISGPVESPSPSPSASSTSSAEPSPSVTAQPTSSPTVTEPAGVDPGTTGSGGAGTGVDDGADGPVDNGGGIIQQISTKLPSIFAVPFAPRTGAAAGILPALLLLGLSASAVSALNKVKKDTK